MMPASGARSPEERFRLQGTLRGIVIAWGIGVATFLTRRSGDDVPGLVARELLHLVVTGLVLQALLFVVRWLVHRYERSAGLEGQLTPLAVYIFELVVDGVTVFLFALATYRGIFQFAEAI